MSENLRKPRRRLPLEKGLFVLALVCVLWFLHPIFLAWALKQSMAAFLQSYSLTVEVDAIEARIGAPVEVRGIRIRTAPGAPHGTWLDISHIEWRWSRLLELASRRGRMFSSFTIHGVAGVLDLRQGVGHNKRQLPKITLRELPSKIIIEDAALEVLARERRWSARNISVSLEENRVGTIQVGEGFLEVGGFARPLLPLQGTTAWKKGSLGIYGIELFPSVLVDHFALDLLHRDGPTLSIKARAFGGSFRSDVTLTQQPSGWEWDTVTWGSGLDVEQACAFLEVRGRAQGRVKEVRLTFRGDPSRPADAEASLRMVAENFRWQERGWESLEVGASLIHRRLALATFDLRQKENRVSADGEMTLEGEWKALARAPFFLNMKADIREVGELAGLLGEPWGEAAGRMTATGTLRSQGGEWDGFLSMEASDLEFRSLQLTGLRGDAIFRRGDLEIVRCEAYSGKDVLLATGNVAIAAPHHYTATLDAQVADLSRTLAPLHALGSAAITAGAAQVRWQGDGNAKSHSGAFDIKLRNFVSRATPTGLTGSFVGTYSPQNIYFSTLAFSNARLRLTTRATIADSGIKLDDTEITDGSISIIEGAAFLPVNLFAKPGATALWKETEGYLRARTLRDIQLGDILRLVGQRSTLEATVRGFVEAGGVPSRPWLVARLDARNLAITRKPSKLEAHVAGGNGRLNLRTSLKASSSSPTTLEAFLPFGLVQSAEGLPQWINPTEAIDLKWDCPSAPLGVIGFCLPELQRIGGEIAGNLRLSGTLAAPSVDGRLTIRGGAFGGVPHLPDFRSVEAAIFCQGNSARIEKWTSLLGGGVARVSGEVGFQPFGGWLSLQGQEIPFTKSPKLELRANVNLQAVGTRAGGEIKGTADFAPSRTHRGLQMSLGADGDFPSLQIARYPNLGQFGLDVKIQSTEPILWKSPNGLAEILPNMTLSGNLANPVPMGRILVRNLKIPVASGLLNFPEVTLDFLPDEPGIPIIRGLGFLEIGTTKIEFMALGSTREKKLLIKSEPPLSSEALLSLVTTKQAEYRLVLHPPLELSERALARSRGRLWDAFDTARWREEPALQSAVSTYQIDWE